MHGHLDIWLHSYLLDKTNSLTNLSVILQGPAMCETGKLLT